MNQEEKTQTEYEEIDLMDYIKVIIKRKRLIWTVFLVAVIIAGIFSFISPKVYKIDTAIEIGQIGEQGVEAPADVEERIDSDVYGILIRGKLGISEKKYPKIETINPKGTKLIVAEVESTKPVKAKNILEEINNLILDEHQEKIKVKKELLEKYIERSKTKVISLEEEKKNLEAKVDALQKILPYQQDPGTQYALFDTKEKLEKKKQEIENLYLEINSLQRSLEDIQLTKIVKVPTVSERPVKPKPLLNIVIAGVLGVFIGVFLAFGKEWWEKNKIKLRALDKGF